ncbi:hypothetical protein D9M71_56280 [compost metagenome]
MAFFPEVAGVSIRAVVATRTNGTGDHHGGANLVGTGVANRVGQNRQITTALDRAVVVFNGSGPPVGLVCRQMQISKAVDIREVVGQASHSQRHILSTKDQAVLVQQVARAQPEDSGTAQRAVVVQGGGVNVQVAVGGKASAVLQGAGAAHGRGPAAGQSGRYAQRHIDRAQGEVAHAAQTAVCAVTATEAESETAVAGDQAVVVPVATAAGEALHSEQLAIRSLPQFADV